MTFYDIVALHRSSDPDVKCILSVPIEADTEDLADDLPCSVGVLPRSIDEDVDDVLFIARDFAHEPTVVAVGPCGLDRAIPVGWVDQIRVFEDQISFSELLCKPMIIHCVRAHADVLTLYRELNVVQPWVVHNFNKGRETMERLTEAGLYVSFGSAVLQDNALIADCVRAIDGSKLFLETNDDSVTAIKNIYERVAALRNISVEDLCNQIEQNFETVFQA